MTNLKAHTSELFVPGTEDIDTLLTDYEQELLSHPILRHPFLVGLSSGRLSREQIGIWIGQQFYFSNQFPRCLAALYSRIEDFEVSKPLMSFLSIEHWGSPESSAHWKMYRGVLVFFGYNLHQLKMEKPFPETSEYLNYRLHLCLTKTVEEGLGALGFGHEFVNAYIFNSYLQGVQKIPNVTEAALRYFKTHVDDEPEDYQVFKRMMIATIKDDQSFALIKKGAQNVLTARQVFFDDMLQRLI